MRWDEASSVPRPERVSPWQIEPAVSPSPVNPLPVRFKRSRSSVNASPSDVSTVNREGLNLALLWTHLKLAALSIITNAQITFSCSCF